MTRKTWRRISLLALFVIAAWFIYLGFHGWVINGMLPAQILGFALVACGVTGLFGVNIWYSGPLDPRRDPPQSQGEELR